jgi:hypothetical protein
MTVTFKFLLWRLLIDVKGKTAQGIYEVMGLSEAKPSHQPSVKHQVNDE